MPVHIVLSLHSLFPALMQTNVEGNENYMAAFCSKFSTRHAKVSGGFAVFGHPFDTSLTTSQPKVSASFYIFSS